MEISHETAILSPVTSRRPQKENIFIKINRRISDAYVIAKSSVP